MFIALESFPDVSASVFISESWLPDKMAGSLACFLIIRIVTIAYKIAAVRIDGSSI
jgi:hypothetical protein